MIGAIINSALAFFYLKEKYPASSYNQGTTFTKDMINNLPVPKLMRDDCDRLVSKVDEIIMMKQRYAKADTSKLEREIDRFVYALYGLTADEIRIVERDSVAKSEAVAA